MGNILEKRKALEAAINTIQTNSYILKFNNLKKDNKVESILKVIDKIDLEIIKNEEKDNISEKEYEEIASYVKYLIETYFTQDAVGISLLTYLEENPSRAIQIYDYMEEQKEYNELLNRYKQLTAVEMKNIETLANYIWNKNDNKYVTIDYMEHGENNYTKFIQLDKDDLKELTGEQYKFVKNWVIVHLSEVLLEGGFVLFEVQSKKKNKSIMNGFHFQDRNIYTIDEKSLSMLVQPSNENVSQNDFIFERANCEFDY